MRRGKTLEGEGVLLKEGPSPSKPPSSSENFPQAHPPGQSDDLIRFVLGGCAWGKFLSFWEVRICCRVRLRTALVGVKSFRMLIVMRATRSSEMTKWADCCVRDRVLVFDKESLFVLALPYALPRSRLLAPLRGSTPRREGRYCSSFRTPCRSAQDDMEENRTAGYNLKAVKVTLVIHRHHAFTHCRDPACGRPCGVRLRGG